MERCSRHIPHVPSPSGLPAHEALEPWFPHDGHVISSPACTEQAVFFPAGRPPWTTEPPARRRTVPPPARARRTPAALGAGPGNAATCPVAASRLPPRPFPAAIHRHRPCSKPSTSARGAPHGACMLARSPASAGWLPATRQLQRCVFRLMREGKAISPSTHKRRTPEDQITAHRAPTPVRCGLWTARPSS